MRILIDIGHPAHVHLFKNLAWQMQNEGHSFFFTVREGENESKLLDAYKFDHKVIGRKQKGILNKLKSIISFTFRICKLSLKFKPDLFISHGSMYAGYAAAFFRKPHIALEDSGNMEQIRFSKPVSSVVLSPDILPNNLGCKQIKYSAYHELFYLHPSYFTPDNSILKLLGIKENEKYVILRFVSWEASHDAGQKGLTILDKIELVHYLSRKMKVFISGERELDTELEKYRIHIPFDRMHDALAFASLYIGEGATMASEAGILGIPSIYVSSIERCYNTDQERFGTVNNIIPGSDTLNRIYNVIERINKDDTLNNRAALIQAKINPTAFLLWFIENYPDSFNIMKENPDYQYRFK